jgi:hypothetical protein
MIARYGFAPWEGQLFRKPFHPAKRPFLNAVIIALTRYGDIANRNRGPICHRVTGERPFQTSAKPHINILKKTGYEAFI